MTKTIKQLNGVLEELYTAKEVTEKQLKESADHYATMMMIKSLGTVKGEDLEELNVDIVSSIAVGSITKATLDAINTEIRAIARVMEEYK